MSAPKNNQNAVKDDRDKALSTVQFRCKREDKARWVKQAQKEGMKLSEWIISKLNQ